MVLKANWHSFAEQIILVILVSAIIIAHTQDGLSSDEETQKTVARKITLVGSAFMLTPQ